MLIRVFIYVVFIIQVSSTWAQTHKDSTSTNKIEEIYNKNRHTRWGKLIFKRNQSNALKNTAVEDKNKKEAKKHQNQIIRKINITTFDPFGKKLNDDNKKPNRYEKIGNAVHLKSKDITIRNFLLIKEGAKFDTIDYSESERILRIQNFIRDVKITTTDFGSKDSVDIDIMVLDTWSMIPRGSISPTNINANLTNRNFLGLGHTLYVKYYNHFKLNTDAYNFRYTIPNLAKKYITSNIELSRETNLDRRVGLSFNRNFYSPLTKWAGGVGYYYNSIHDSLPTINPNELNNYNFKYGNFNIWGGYSKSLFKDETGFTNLILSVKYNSLHYFNNTNYTEDPYNFYRNENTILFSTGIISLDYSKDKYIFYDNLIEYIPVGKSLSFTIGHQRKNKITRPYIGSNLSFGDYFSTGYFGGSLQFGTFLEGKSLTQSVLKFEATYFTRVFSLGSWKFRQFFNPEFIIGFNRLPYEKDKITLNGRNGIEGFENYHLRGTKKLLLNFQTQAYSPKEIFGFRLNPFLNMSLGMIGDDQHKLFKNNLYARLGLGVQINNDYLIFDKLQLSISFFPNLQDRGKNILRFNDLKNTQFGLQQFNLGQPSTILYE